MKAYLSLEAYDMFQDKHARIFFKNVNPMQQYKYQLNGWSKSIEC